MTALAAVPWWADVATVAGVTGAVALLVGNARELAWHAAQDALEAPASTPTDLEVPA